MKTLLASLAFAMLATTAHSHPLDNLNNVEKAGWVTTLVSYCNGYELKDKAKEINYFMNGNAPYEAKQAYVTGAKSAESNVKLFATKGLSAQDVCDMFLYGEFAGLVE